MKQVGFSTQGPDKRHRPVIAESDKVFRRKRVFFLQMCRRTQAERVRGAFERHFTLFRIVHQLLVETCVVAYV